MEELLTPYDSLACYGLFNKACSLTSNPVLSFHGVTRVMLLVHCVLTDHKTSEPLYRRPSVGKWRRQIVLTATQEITNVKDGLRDEPSRVHIDIHDYKVFWDEDMKCDSSSRACSYGAIQNTQQKYIII